MLDPYEPPNVTLGNLKFEELTFLLLFIDESSNFPSFKFWAGSWEAYSFTIAVTEFSLGFYDLSYSFDWTDDGCCIEQANFFAYAI